MALRSAVIEDSGLKSIDCRCVAVALSFGVASSLPVFIVLFGLGELALFATQVTARVLTLMEV